MALAAFVETELNRASRDQSRSNEGIEAGVIARTEQQLGQFRADLVHLDVRLFAPELEPKTIPTKRIRRSDGGSSKASYPAACSTRFARQGS
jgi:hypothetical protein